MENNSTMSPLCCSVYDVIRHSVFVGVAIFGIITGILVLITIPKLRLGVLPAVLLFILAITDLLILGFQVPQVIILENNCESFAGFDTGTRQWYARSYARRLRLTLYLFEGWMVICLTLNRFIFVRWPYYDGKYMTSKCAVISVLSFALVTLILEAPAFGKIVMSQVNDNQIGPNITTTTTTTANFITTTPIAHLSTESAFNDSISTGKLTELTTIAFTTKNQLTTLEDAVSTTFIQHSTIEPMESTKETPIPEVTTSETENVADITSAFQERQPNSSTVTESTPFNTQTATIEIDPNNTKPNLAGVMFRQIRDTYVEVLDRFVTTLVPLITVIPFLIIMAVILPGGHPRMRTLSHEVIMERSAVVIMLTGVTWYVLANIPYQVFSLVTWLTGKPHKCHGDLLFHVTSITLTCAFKPLIYFIVCPHFRRTLGSICSAKKKPKESFGTPSFDRISSRVLSSNDLNLSRDSRDSRGSYFDITESTEL